MSVRRPLLFHLKDKKMRKAIPYFLALFGSACMIVSAAASLRLTTADLNNAPKHTLTFPDGSSVTYRSFEQLYYVGNVVDSTYQYLNFYVPEAVYASRKKAPVFLKTNVGGYMASKASAPRATDATGRALQEGYLVVIPGARGANSMVKTPAGDTIWTGRAPAGLVDLKAAIRYLRHNQAVIPGDMERIITDGTSAGGAMSSLLGATGNHPLYEPYLKALQAADERDDVFAAVCYCPITDLEHADMAYEWLYQRTNTGTRNLSADQKRVSEELAEAYPAYLESLKLHRPDGELLTRDNYLPYLKSFLIRSAQRARNEGCEIPEAAGVIFNKEQRGGNGEWVIDIDIDRYLDYVIGHRALKTPPAFDQLNVLIPRPTPENNVFGDETGSAVNYTAYSLRRASKDTQANVSADLSGRVRLMNPMLFIGDGISTTAPNWYIRHGALDRDTGFSVPVNLYTKLQNNGYHVDFHLPWNRNHAGDYNLDDLFRWLSGL